MWFLPLGEPFLNGSPTKGRNLIYYEIMIKSAAIIIPPLSDFYFTRHRFSSLGATIAAQLLERVGIKATILNFPLMNVKGTVTGLPPELAYLKPFIIENETGRLSFFTHYRRFGPSFDQCAERVAALRPDICIFSLFAFCYGDDALTLAAAIKKSTPAMPIAIGGAGVSAYPDYFLKNAAFDFVLQGEAESCLPQFIEKLSQPEPDWNSIPGMHFKRTNGLLQHSPPPPPAAADAMLLPFVKTTESARTITFATSLARGCPKRCNFCSSSLFFGRKLRTVPIPQIEELLKNRASEFAQSGKRIVVNIEDDNLLCDESLFKFIISLFRRHIPSVEFIAENGLDYTLLTPELCGWLIDNGMRKFNLSLASTNPAILRNRNRGFDLDRYEKVLALLAERNIPSVTYVICGFEEDTVQTVAEALNYLAAKPTIIGLSPFYPVPGLPGFTDPKVFDEQGARRCCGSGLYPWNGSLSTATMVTAFRLARLGNLIKSKYLNDLERELIAVIRKEKRLLTIIKGKDGKEKIATVEGMDGELIEKVKIAFKAFGGGTEFKSNAYEGETSLRGLPILPNRQNRRNIDSFD
jgi:radical SAM superfamily enzyme YgiQ (UPF0313 family)